MFLTEPIPAGKPSPYPRKKRINGYGTFGLLGFTPLQRDAEQIDLSTFGVLCAIDRATQVTPAFAPSPCRAVSTHSSADLLGLPVRAAVLSRPRTDKRPRVRVLTKRKKGEKRLKRELERKRWVLLKFASLSPLIPG
jgi:hypothetical protein